MALRYFSEISGSRGDRIRSEGGAGFTIESASAPMKLKSVSFTMQLPTADAAAGIPLCTNGSGTLQFIAIGTTALADSAVTPVKLSTVARSGHRIYKTITGDTTLTIADWTDGGVAYPPSTTELVVRVDGVTGTITITMPSDAALAAGTRIRFVKGTANNFTCTLTGPNIQTGSGGNIATTNQLWSTASTALSFVFEYTGVAWAATGQVRTANYLSSPALSMASNSVAGRASNTSGQGGDISVPINRLLGTSAAGTTGGLQATPLMLDQAALTGKRIYKTITADTSLALSDWTSGGVAYDPAQVELVVIVNGVSGTITVTLPTDAALVAGCRVRVAKGNANNFAANLAGPNIQNLAGASNLASTRGIWGATTGLALSAAWQYTGAAWVADGLSGTANSLASTAVNLAGNSVAGTPSSASGGASSIPLADGYLLGTTGTTTGQTKADDAHSAFTSPSNNVVLGSVAPTTRQGTASLAAAATFTATVALGVNLREVETLWRVKVTYGGVTYVLAYITTFRRDGSGVVTSAGVMAASLPTGRYSPPPAVTVSQSVSGTNGQLSVLNGTAGAIEVEIDPTHVTTVIAA